jgi:D-hydroxyproline dehydrogenase subunit beta
MRERFDVAVVGAGILGLAHALAAARRGLAVVVLDRDAQANGASVRNFGFVTITGQEGGATFARARRSRDVWLEVAGEAGIAIEHRGVAVAAQRPEAVDLLEAFAATPLAEGCELVSRSCVAERFPALGGGIAAVLWSPHEVRVEPRLALPRLAAHLERAHGVTILRATSVHALEPPRLDTSRGPVLAETAILCPGDDFSLCPASFAVPGLTRCKLQMLRVGPCPPLAHAVLSDLSLVRYGGFADLPAAAPLKARLAAEQPRHLAEGVHLVVAGSADGTRVVGDSHRYAATPDPFAEEAVDALILDEYAAVFGERPPVVERWIGTYASLPDRPVLVDAPAPNLRVVTVTSGTGMSTAFALAEETLAGLFGARANAA